MRKIIITGDTQINGEEIIVNRYARCGGYISQLRHKIEKIIDNWGEK